MRIKAILFFVAATFLLSAQNYKQDILLVSKYFTSLKNYSVTMHYRLYLDNDFVKPYQERNVKIKRFNKNLLLSNTAGLEIIDTENYNVIVNTKNKVFSVRKKFKEEKEQGSQVEEYQKYMDNNFDSLLMVYEKIKVLENTGSTIKYELTYKANAEFEKSIIVIDKIKNMYLSTTVQYKNPIKVNRLDEKKHTVTMVVNYEDFKVNNVYSSTLFSEKNYINIEKNGKPVPIKKYSDYKLIIPEDEEI